MSAQSKEITIEATAVIALSKSGNSHYVRIFQKQDKKEVFLKSLFHWNRNDRKEAKKLGVYDLLRQAEEMDD